MPVLMPNSPSTILLVIGIILLFFLPIVGPITQPVQPQTVQQSMPNSQIPGPAPVESIDANIPGPSNEEFAIPTSKLKPHYFVSCARDKNQLAFIINGQSKELKKLMFNNLANPEFDVNLALEFAHFKIDKKKEDWLKARESGKYGTFWDRVAYVLFGLPNKPIANPTQ